MEYCVIMQVEVVVEADNEQEAMSLAESELNMTDCGLQRVLAAYPVEDD